MTRSTTTEATHAPRWLVCGVLRCETGSGGKLALFLRSKGWGIPCKRPVDRALPVNWTPPFQPGDQSKHNSSVAYLVPSSATGSASSSVLRCGVRRLRPTHLATDDFTPTTPLISPPIWPTLKNSWRKSTAYIKSQWGNLPTQPRRRRVHTKSSYFYRLLELFSCERPQHF